MKNRHFLRPLRAFCIVMIITGVPAQLALAEQLITTNIKNNLSLRIEITSKKEKLCKEKEVIEYVSKTLSNLKNKMQHVDLSGRLKWTLRLMAGNWHWSNGVDGVWGESEIYIEGSRRNHSFGLNEGHDGIGRSQWAAAKGTIDTHMMYLFIMLLNLEKLSPNLNEFFDVFTDIDHDLYPKVQNQLIIASSHTPTDVLLKYLKYSPHDLLKAIAACGLAMKGNKKATEYLDKSLFDRLSMSDYREAAIEKLGRGKSEEMPKAKN